MYTVVSKLVEISLSYSFLKKTNKSYVSVQKIKATHKNNFIT